MRSNKAAASTTASAFADLKIQNKPDYEQADPTAPADVKVNEQAEAAQLNQAWASCRYAFKEMINEMDKTFDAQSKRYFGEDHKHLVKELARIANKPLPDTNEEAIYKEIVAKLLSI